jgi:hypothetical protein
MIQVSMSLLVLPPRQTASALLGAASGCSGNLVDGIRFTDYSNEAGSWSREEMCGCRGPFLCSPCWEVVQSAVHQTLTSIQAHRSSDSKGT